MTERQTKFIIREATNEAERLSRNATLLSTRAGTPDERSADADMAADARERADAWKALVQKLAVVS